MGNMCSDQVPSKKLNFIFLTNSDFLIQGPNDLMPELSKTAEKYGHEIVSVTLRTKQDLIGNPVVHQSENGQPYFARETSWGNQILENPEKKFLLLFIVDEADNYALSALKSFVDAHDIQGQRPGNFFVGLICHDNEKIIPETIRSFLHHINS